MDIYVVSMATTQGPPGPVVTTRFFKDHQEALDEFTECTKALTDDPSTILLIRLNTDTMAEEILEAFEGTDEDYMDQRGRDYEDDEGLSP
jgi:hypothetical protein